MTNLPNMIHSLDAAIVNNERMRAMSCQSRYVMQALMIHSYGGDKPTACAKCIRNECIVRNPDPLEFPYE